MKPYVLTITPNPALDIGGIVDKLKPNEKVYVHKETRCPGGNGINVARILHRLGIPVIATGFIGASTGEEIDFLLDSEGVRSKFVAIEGHSRICVTVSSNADQKQTRLTFPGPYIRKMEKKRIFDIVKNGNGVALLMLGGSLPKGFSNADVLHILRLARKRKFDSIVDCPASVMRSAIEGRPLLIKPNLDEFQELIKKKIRSIHSVHQEARKLLDRVAHVCVSSVEGGTLLVTRGHSFFGRIPPVKVKSTVGAGDSMVGAMAAQFFLKNSAPEELLRWGLAASAATLSHSGTAMGRDAEIRRLYKLTTIRRVG